MHHRMAEPPAFRCCHLRGVILVYTRLCARPRERAGKQKTTGRPECINRGRSHAGARQGLLQSVGRGFRSAAVIDGTAGDHWSPLRRQPASLHGRGAYARASEMPIKFLRGRGTFFKKCHAGAFLPQERFSLRKKTCFSRKSVFPLPNTTHSAPRSGSFPLLPRSVSTQQANLQFGNNFSALTP